MLSLSAGVVNGWDNVADNNNGKTFLGSLGLEVGNLAWTFNGVYGAEDDDSGASKTGVFDTVLTYTPMDHVDFLINFDHGTASDVLGAKKRGVDRPVGHRQPGRRPAESGLGKVVGGAAGRVVLGTTPTTGPAPTTGTATSTCGKSPPRSSGR